MIKSKFLVTANTSILLLFLAIIIPAEVTLSQNNNISPKNQLAIPGKDWVKFSKISQKFMQGCLGTQPLPQAQSLIKQNYCKCALSSYQGRYTPEVFSEINTYVTKIGKETANLVNLMMTPELSQCIAKTGYQNLKP